MSPVMMTITVWVILTLLLLVVAPMYRSYLVLSGKHKANDFPRGQHQGPAWYQRTMDAFANSIEHMVLFLAIVFVMEGQEQLAILDDVAYYFLAARIGQIIMHLFSVNAWTVQARFAFWLMQIGLLFYALIRLLCVYL